MNRAKEEKQGQVLPSIESLNSYLGRRVVGRCWGLQDDTATRTRSCGYKGANGIVTAKIQRRNVKRCEPKKKKPACIVPWFTISFLWFINLYTIFTGYERVARTTNYAGHMFRNYIRIVLTSMPNPNWKNMLNAKKYKQQYKISISS